METTLNKQPRILISDKTKKIIVDVIAYLFIALFIYTAASKIMTYREFETVLHRSVLIGNYSSIIAWLIPTVEIIISTLLLIPLTKRIGLIASLGLMTVFTLYLIYMINSGSKLSCTCGGFVSSLSWKAHIWFNISFIILALIGINLYKKE
ncbi:MauE/DoxX family redox-associated membrane protein [Pedobacter nyackensis]|uniref:MauE/DoxX family redox-associated membrane protein n=1 Tax=Pedobacter nyackensis TaxID=475255 RepID=UPI00292DA66B|nr:MauE/DoxX family redox-associated membrane protein [Pedobacter nyackensis]